MAAASITPMQTTPPVTYELESQGQLARPVHLAISSEGTMMLEGGQMVTMEELQALMDEYTGNLVLYANAAAPAQQIIIRINALARNAGWRTAFVVQRQKQAASMKRAHGFLLRFIDLGLLLLMAFLVVAELNPTHEEALPGRSDRLETVAPVLKTMRLHLIPRPGPKCGFCRVVLSCAEGPFRGCWPTAWNSSFRGASCLDRKVMRRSRCSFRLWICAQFKAWSVR